MDGQKSSYPQFKIKHKILNLEEISKAYNKMFYNNPRLFYAPGRVNLIGEHTDYNNGYVLPVAINLGTVVAGNLRDDHIIKVHSVNLNDTYQFDLNKIQSAKKGAWYSYVEGVIRLLDEGFSKWNRKLQGANFLIEGNVPLGAGLSSSASLEVAIIYSLLGLNDLSLDLKTIAFIAQKAENTYVCAECGLMDQLISCLGQKNNALLIDINSLEISPIPLDLNQISLVICNTGIKHELSDSAYNDRREECEQGVKLLNELIPEKELKTLRDVSLEEYDYYKDKLPSNIRKRCKHVLNENLRTLNVAGALQKGSYDELKELMYQSHLSLKDDFEVSCPELDKMVEIALSIDGVIASRMTGGGFGGSTVNLVKTEALENFKNTVIEEYKKFANITPEIYNVETSDGVSEITQLII